MLSIKNIFQNNFILSISLNLLYMIIMILCFEQFATYDDYTMAVQFAGGIGEEYANGHTFVSPLYGKLIIFLNNLVPSLPWFNIVFTAIVFLSLTLLTYEILERENRTMALLICNVIILFFSYEGYVGTCFTKIAGIASVCGIYILLCGRKTVCNIFLSLLILCLGILLRNDMMFMALMIAIAYIIYYFFLHFINTKQFPKKELFSVAITIIVCVCLYFGLSNEKMLFGTDYSMYENWLEENSYRSRIQDYPLPEYEQNVYEYEEVDIVENDLFIFYGWNFDRFKLDEKVYDKIMDLEEQGPSFLESVFSLENIYKFMKNYPKYFLEMDVWFGVIIIILAYVLFSKKENIKFIILNTSFAIGLNFLLMYYLYIKGRYNQHRVDIAIELAIIIGFFTVSRKYMLDVECCNKKKVYIIISFLLLSVPYTFHDDFWWGAIGDDLKTEISTFCDKTEEDKEHFYLLGNQRGQADIFMMYSLWDVTKDTYEDKFINTSLVSNFYQTDYLQEFDIEDVYKEAVDSDKIRFVLNESNQEIEQWEEYFSRRSGKKVKLVQVQSSHWKKIYSIMTEGNHFEDIRVSESVSNLVNEDIKTIIKEKELSISGNVYIEGKNEFGQRVFLQIRDSETDKISEYALLQIEDKEMLEKDVGYYSKIDQIIQLPSWYSNNDEVILIVENDGEYYTKKMQIDD